MRRALLPLIRDLLDRLGGGDTSLAAIAARAGWSPFHLHRAFSEAVGETPKKYTQRLRLERAAARLATTESSVLDIALANAAVERWIEENGLRTGGAPWEWYVTDPGEHPDPADWKTEVYWPLAE